MPNKKRSHGRRKKSKQQAEESGRGVSPFQSDPKQPKPTASAPVSTVKPTECEKGATKPGAAKPGTPAVGASATPTVAAAGTVSSATGGAGLSAAAKVSAGTSPRPSAAGAPPTGAAASSTGTQSGSSKVTPQAPPASPAKPPQASAGGGATGGVGGAGGGAEKPSTSPVKPTDPSKDKAQSTAVSSTKPEPPKVTPTDVAKSSATSSLSKNAAQKDDPKKSKEAKVPVERSVPGVKTSAPVSTVDPFDALADSLPSSDPLAPTPPQYKGPEVKERDITSEVANRCGEKDSTLPPGYRREDMEKKIPAGKPDKPKEQPKPITTDEALESLSAGFVSSEAPSKPGGKQEASGSPAAPADKKAKVDIVSPKQSVTPKTDMEKKIPAETPDPHKKKPTLVLNEVVDSASAGFVSSSAPKLESKQEVAPPAGKKAKVEKLTQDPVKPAPPSSQDVKSNKGDMSLEALDALGDMLPVSQPTPEAPAPRPEDIVHEKDLNKKEGVRVGEREDSLPPEYRFSKEKLEKYPAPPKQPSLDPAEALDLLSDDFTASAAAPVVQASAPPSAPPKQQPKVEDLSALDTLKGDVKKVACGVPSAPAKVAKSTMESTSDEGDALTLDALSALGDTLPVAKPTPESPKLRPEDIVDEKKLTSEKGVRVGEREDTLPPDYRFPKEDVAKHPPPPQREPSMDPADALDILSGDFSSSTAAAADRAPVPPSAPPADSVDFAIEDLAGDFVAPTAVSKVQAAAPAPPKADRQLSENTASAMDALGDTLMDVTPAPQPKPVSPKDIVKEKEAVEERVSKPGERDDSLPPEYRPTEADIKAAAEAKAKAKAEDAVKKASMDESAALDVLSTDFSTPSVAPPAAPVASPACPAAKTPLTQMPPGPVLDSLAATLLPDFPESKDSKPKDSKPKVKGGKSKSKAKKPATVTAPATAASGKPSTDVVSASPTKKGGQS